MPAGDVGVVEGVVAVGIGTGRRVRHLRAHRHRERELGHRLAAAAEHERARRQVPGEALRAGVDRERRAAHCCRCRRARQPGKAPSASVTDSQGLVVDSVAVQRARGQRAAVGQGHRQGAALAGINAAAGPAEGDRGHRQPRRGHRQQHRRIPGQRTVGRHQVQVHDLAVGDVGRQRDQRRRRRRDGLRRVDVAVRLRTGSSRWPRARRPTASN